VKVVENVFTPWKLIPSATFQSLKKSLSQESTFKKFLKLLSSLIKIPYISLELAGQALFFFANPYWQACSRAIYTTYVALLESKNPDPDTLAIIGALLSHEKDPEKAFQIAVETFNFSISSPGKLSKLPFTPDQPVEPEALKLFRQAAFNLRDLYASGNLPSFCFTHHKVYWTSCPMCSAEKV